MFEYVIWYLLDGKTPNFKQRCFREERPSDGEIDQFVVSFIKFVRREYDDIGRVVPGINEMRDMVKIRSLDRLRRESI